MLIWLNHKNKEPIVNPFLHVNRKPPGKAILAAMESLLHDSCVSGKTEKSVFHSLKGDVLPARAI